MIQWHKIVLAVATVCLIAVNLHIRTGMEITLPYKGYYHPESTEHVRVFTPSGRNDDILVPVKDYQSQRDTGQRVQVELVSAYCVPWYRKAADSNLFLIFSWMMVFAIAWLFDRSRAKFNMR